ncbi:hypothetical protein AeMF1_018586 [Aphanomyces euteiches]|nr:hypothetical protein AeMF1_018586 [Aphanomyces euteiches]KAH9189505.1 hypothetical protein AeNC1_008514 [Aphanomyces euteiches]
MLGANEKVRMDLSSINTAAMHPVQLRFGYPQEEIDRIFNVSERATPAASPSFHSRHSSEPHNRRTSAENLMQPAVHAERGTIMGQKIDPNIPCWPGSGFVPLVLPVQKAPSKKLTTDNVAQESLSPSTLHTIKTKRNSIAMPIKTKRKRRSEVPQQEATSADDYASLSLTPNLHTKRTPRSKAQENHSSFHVHTSIKANIEPHQQILRHEAESRHLEKVTEHRRWTEAVHWLKAQREALQHDDKINADLKRQKLQDMDRQIRLQNQKRFAKSMYSTPSQPIQRPAPDDLTLPPRKPPVPRFSKIKKRRSKSAIQDEKTEDEAPHPAPRLRRKVKKSTPLQHEVPPSPHGHRPEIDDEETRRRREVARVFMEQQKKKRTERARKQRLQTQEEIAARREQLEKLDALRRERVQQSVALARKNGKKESTSHNQQQNDVSITELLLGFQQSPQVTITPREILPELDTLETEDEEELPTESAPEFANDVDESSAQETEEDTERRLEPPQQPRNTLLEKLQALKNLTDQLSSRVSQLSNNATESVSSASDKEESSLVMAEHNDVPGPVMPNLPEQSQLSSRHSTEEELHGESAPDELLDEQAQPFDQIPDTDANLDISSSTEFEALEQPRRAIVFQWSSDESEGENEEVGRSAGPSQLNFQVNTKDDDETRAPTTTRTYDPPIQSEITRPPTQDHYIADLSESSEEDGIAVPHVNQNADNLSAYLERDVFPELQNFRQHSREFLWPRTSFGAPAISTQQAEEEDEIAQAELDRLVAASRDAYSVVDMFALEQFRKQQERPTQAYLPNISVVEQVEAKLQAWEASESIASNGESSDTKNEDEKMLNEKLSSQSPSENEIDSTNEEMEELLLRSRRERSVDELLNEANRILQPATDASAYWDQAIRDDMENFEEDMQPPRSYSHKTRIILDIDGSSSDSNLRYSPRTLSRQLLAAVEFQESLHEAQMNLSAIEYAHELERTQEETLIWGQTVQDDVDTMANAHALLEQHIKMQEEFHQQELVLQAMGHAVEEREGYIEMACQTEDPQRQHASTMATWMVEASTMAIETTEGFTQSTLRCSVAIQSDDRDMYDWHAKLHDDNLEDQDLKAPRDVSQLKSPTPVTNTTTTHAKALEAIDKKAQELSVAVESDIDDENYSEVFNSPSKAKVEAMKKSANSSAEEIFDNYEVAEHSNGFDRLTKSKSMEEMLDQSVDDVETAEHQDEVHSELDEMNDEYSQGFDNPTKEKSMEIQVEEDDEQNEEVAIGNVLQSEVDDLKSENDEMIEVYSQGFDSPVKENSMEIEIEDDDDPNSEVDTMQNDVKSGVDEIEDEYSKEFDSPVKDKSMRIEVNEDQVDEDESKEGRNVVSEVNSTEIDEDNANSAVSDVDEIVEYSSENKKGTQEHPQEAKYGYSEDFESSKSDLQHAIRVEQDIKTGSGTKQIQRSDNPQSHFPTGGALKMIVDAGTINRVEVYLNHLRENDPEKEEYIRSILLRKTSEEKILDMRQRNLDNRKNISQMLYHAERMQLDSCRAANIARCYEDMMLFRQNEPEDPDDFEILTLAFGQSVIIERTYQATTEVRSKVENTAQIAKKFTKTEKDHEEASNVEGSEINYSMDDFNSQEKVDEAERSEIEDSFEEEEEEQSTAKEDIAPLESADKVENLEIDDTFEEYEDETIVEAEIDEVGDDVAEVAQTYSVEMFTEDMPREDQAVGADIEDDYSMDDFSTKENVEGGNIQSTQNDEENYSVDDFASVEDTTPAHVQDQTAIDKFQVDSISNFVENEEEEGFEEDYNDDFDEAEPFVAEDAENSITDVVGNTNNKDDGNYSEDEFVSTPNDAIGSFEEPQQTRQQVEDDDRASEVYSMDDFSKSKDQDAADSIDDDVKSEPGKSDNEYQFDDFASTSHPVAEVSPQKPSSRSPENIPGGEMDTFAVKNASSNEESIENEYSEDDEHSIEKDLDTAEKESNTSQELQMALEKIEKDYPQEIFRDEEKWQRRKAKAIALVEAKQRAIAQLKKKEEINAIVAYSLSLNIEEEVKKSSVSSLNSIITTNTSRQEATTISSAPIAPVPNPVESKSTVSADEYSDSFEDVKSDAAYDDDEFDEEVQQVQAETTNTITATTAPASSPVESQTPSEIPHHESNTDMDLESSLSKSIDEHENRLMELKETLMSRQTESLKVKSQLMKEERRVELQAQEQELARQIDQIERLVASDSSRLTELHQQRTSSVGNKTLQQATMEEEASFDDGNENTAYQDEMCEFVDPTLGPKPSKSVEFTTPPDVTINPDNKQASFGLDEDDVAKSLEMSIVEGESMSDDFDDDSFASGNLETPEVMPPSQEELPSSSKPTRDSYVAETILPQITAVAEVLDDSFSSLGDESFVEVDLLAAFDHIEAAEHPPQVNCDVAIQTNDAIYNPLDLYDYIEDAEPVVSIPLPQEINYVSSAEPHPDTTREIPSNLLAQYHHIEDALSPESIPAHSLYEDLLHTFDHVEIAEPPPKLNFPLEVTQPTSALPREFREADLDPEVALTTERDLFSEYDYIEDVLPLATFPLFHEPRPSSDLFITNENIHVAEAAEEIDSSVDSISKDELTTPSPGLLESFDYVEAAEPRLLSDSRVHGGTTDGNGELTVTVRENTIPEEEQVDAVTNILWSELFHEVLATLPSSKHNATNLSTSVPTSLEGTPAVRGRAEVMGQGSQATKLNIDKKSPNETETESTCQIDRVTDLLMEEIIADTFSTTSKNLPKRRVSIQRDPPATAPDRSPLHQVTEFPEQYSTIMKAREPHDWSEWDQECLHSISEKKPSPPPTPSASANVLHSRRRLLTEWRGPSANRRKYFPTAAPPISIKENLREQKIATEEAVRTLTTQFVKRAVTVDESLLDEIFDDLLQDTAIATDEVISK